MYEKILRIFKQGCRQVQKHGRNVKKTSRKDGSQCSTVVTGQSSNPSCSQDKSDIQDTIPRSVHYTISHQTQNWLKAVLALRIAREYVSPVLDEFVQDMHQELVQKHGRNVSLNQIAQFRENGEVPSLLRAWINDVRSFHRTPPSTGAIRRITDVTKWPTREGAWEIARVFMAQGFRTGSENDSASFDVSAVFNYIYRCRTFEGHIEDINIARNILKARNMAMHSPMSEFTEPQLQTCLDVVDSLFNDETLKS
uniref:Uncharacterized protein n=1 Tax=Ciona savignyi TaxID=51511 RepID=H2YLE4_CIOSA